MSESVIDLSAERNARERPDPEFIRKDDFGREIYCYALEYEMDDAEWLIVIWAYSLKEAEARVLAMRKSLVLKGQIHRKVGTVSL